MSAVEKLTIEQLSNVCKVLIEAPSKVPDDMKFTDAKYTCKAVLENSANIAENDSKFGIMLATDDIKDIIDYFEKIIANKDVENVRVSLYCHSNCKNLNYINGCCEIEYTDFAEIRVITSDKTILIYCNKMDNKTRKIANFVKIFDTSWKVLKDKKIYISNIDYLIDRIVITSAIHLKAKNITENKFRDQLYSYDDYSMEEILGIFKNENSRKVDLTGRKDLANILKTIYARLVDEKVRTCGSGAFNDCTVVDFEYKEHIITFSLDFSSVTMQLV